jgi:hypothetical protein
LREVTLNSEFLSVRLMHGTGKKKVGMVVVIMKGVALKYLEKQKWAVIMNRVVLIDVKGLVWGL